MKRPAIVREMLELWRLPTVRIAMSGGAQCHGYYDAFTRRHARWRLIQNKAWGVALLELPDTSADYRSVVSEMMRRRTKRATKAGFTFARVDPLSRLDEILAVNRSADQRQGVPMHPDYLDVDKVRRYFERGSDVYGVLDPDGVLRAYLSTMTCGDVAFVERILGHADSLEAGVMYLLIDGAVTDMIDRRRRDGRPIWFMYDMFSGATPGMWQFKHVIGCRSYRVSWSWQE